MIVHLVHAHSEPDSFCAAMRDVVAGELTTGGAEVTISDLYAMDFDPVSSAADFRERRRSDHLIYALEQRHGFETRTLSPDIQAEVGKVLRADLLAFTFPVHWYSVPAILKGWIDRVFLSGPFYGGKRIYGAGGLAGKRAFVAMSMGARPHMFGPGSLHGELEFGMMRHFFQGTLGYVGLAVHQPFVAWHVPYVDADRRAGMLDELRQAVRDLDARPLLPMPDPTRYDETFAPLDE